MLRAPADKLLRSWTKAELRLEASHTKPNGCFHNGSGLLVEVIRTCAQVRALAAKLRLAVNTKFKLKRRS